MANDFLVFWVDCPARFLGRGEDFLKLLADDHKDLLVCLKKFSRICH